MAPIAFGTDGWRAVIAEEYTFQNVNIVTQATAAWIKKSGVTKNGVVIGYDCRFLSRKFAEHAASVFAEMEIPVRLSNQIVPTPAISWAAKEFDAIGVVITASHNPPEYNGFKLKAPYGGSASPEQIKGVEQELPAISGAVDVKPFSFYQKTGLVRELDFTEGYLEEVRSRIDIGAIKNSGIRIAHDPMYGAGIGQIKKLLGDQVVEIHNAYNPNFGGIAPEPIEQNAGLLSKTVIDHSCAIGLSNDGDADRIGVVDENGDFVSSHKLLCLLAAYLYKVKGMTGTIVKTFSTTDMLDKLAKSYGLPIKVTPIGFKYIADIIINGDVLVGGEESGGISVKGHLPERDGIYIGLLVTELMVKSGKKLSELVQDLFDEFGEHHYYRNDISTKEEKKLAMTRFCREKKLTDIAGLKVVEWQMTDGIKHQLEDGSWLLVRQSGTEPVLRIYAEAASRSRAKSLVEAVTRKVDDPSILKPERVSGS